MTPGVFSQNSIIDSHGINMNGWKFEFIYESKSIHVLTMKNKRIAWFQSGRYGLLVSHSIPNSKYTLHEYEACPILMQVKHCFEFRSFTLFIIKGISDNPNMTADEIINGFEIINRCDFPVLINFNNIKFEGHRYSNLGQKSGSFDSTSLIIISSGEAAAFRSPKYVGCGSNFSVTCFDSCYNENDDIIYRHESSYDDPCYCLADTGEILKFDFNVTEVPETNKKNGYDLYKYVVDTPATYSIISASSTCIIQIDSVIQPLLVLIIGSYYSQINITCYNQTTMYVNSMNEAMVIDSGNTSITVEILAYSGFQAIVQSVGGSSRFIGYVNSTIINIDKSTKFFMLWGDKYDLFPECVTMDYVPPKNIEKEEFNCFLAHLSENCSQGNITIRSSLAKSATTVFNVEQNPVMKAIRAYSNMNDFSFFYKTGKGLFE